MFTTLSPRVKWTIGSAITVVLIAVGATAAYAVSYADRALPGISIAHQSITGMTREEAVASVEQRASDTMVTIDVDGLKTSTTLADAGVNIDADKTVEAAFSANASVGSQLRALVTSTDIEPVIVIDEAKLAEFATTVAESTGNAAKEAEVVLDAEAARFVSTEASAGTLVDADDITETVTTQAKALASGEASLHVQDVTPVVTSEAAAAAAQAANALIAPDVTLTDGDASYTASAADKASWVEVPTNDDGTLAAPTINAGKTRAWLSGLADTLSVEPTKGVNNVNSEGKVLTVHRQGIKGWSVNNIDAMTEGIVSSLNAGTAYTSEITYDEIEPEYDTRTIAEGAENLVYQAAPGEKWIDLDLSTNTVVAYEGASIVGGPFYMVPGAPDTPTVTGVFHVYSKLVQQTMRGENSDGTKYVTPDVPWVTYWYSGYAFHGAPWRSTFGWSGYGGSHGCINMPVSSAKYIYDWADIGTTVVSHY